MMHRFIHCHSVLTILCLNFSLHYLVFWVDWESLCCLRSSFCWYLNLTFDNNVIADDYDRSINEAIKITKYRIRLILTSSIYIVLGGGN